MLWRDIPYSAATVTHARGRPSVRRCRRSPTVNPAAPARDRSSAGLECQVGPAPTPPPTPPPSLHRRLFDIVTAPLLSSPLADFLQQNCRQRCRDSGRRRDRLWLSVALCLRSPVASRVPTYNTRLALSTVSRHSSIWPLARSVLASRNILTPELGLVN